MLRRLGSKKRLLPKLLSCFPDNIITFVDMFMGTGIVSFAMTERAKYVISNDNDADVYNLFMVVKEQKRRLISHLEMMPIHEKLFKAWADGKQEDDPVWRACRFLMLSNFGFLGKAQTMKFGNENTKRIMLADIQKHFRKISFIQFMNADFRKVLSKINRNPRFEKTAFVYADPPYLFTDNNYATGFTEKDSADLFDILVGSGARFAVSEFDNPVVLGLAKKHGLNVVHLGERRNLLNRRTEILITNYKKTRPGRIRSGSG